MFLNLKIKINFNVPRRKNKNFEEILRKIEFVLATLFNALVTIEVL
ncbi:hypothetical protein [Desulfonauticus submarinus]